MIEIKFNGKLENIDENMSVADLLKKKGIPEISVISVLNLTVVNNNKIAETFLKDKDEVEIIRVVAGG